MIDTGTFKPKTVYVIYIAATPEKVWQALTDPELSQRYFHGSRLEVEPKVGGSFAVRFPDGRLNVRGEVVEWSPLRRLATTWIVEWVPETGSPLSRGRADVMGPHRSAALIFSSDAEPGQSSFASSVLSGFSTVLRWTCRSSGS